MVQITEHNKSLVKIVLRFPSGPVRCAECLPFILELREHFPESEIGVIGFFEDLTMLQLLPFTVYAHPIPRTVKGVLNIHRFAYNLHPIFNLDYYFDLEGTFDSAFLGFCLRAKKRIGPDEKLRKFFYHHRVLINEQLPAYSESFKLLSSLNYPLSGKNPITLKRINPYFEDHFSNPYFVINLESVNKEESERLTFEKVKELLDFFEFESVVLIGGDEEQELALKIKTGSSLKNKYQIFCSDKLSWFERVRITSFAQGLITMDSVLAHLNSFMAGRTLIIYNNETFNDKIPQFGSGLYRFVEKFEVAKVVDAAYELFTFKKKEGPVTGPLLKLIKNESE